MKFRSCLDKTSTLRLFCGLTTVPLGSFMKTWGYFWTLWIVCDGNTCPKQCIYQKKIPYSLSNEAGKRCQKWSSLTQNCRVVPGHRALKIALLYISFSSSFTKKNLRARILVVLELETICQWWYITRNCNFLIKRDRTKMLIPLLCDQLQTFGNNSKTKRKCALKFFLVKLDEKLI